MQEEEQRSAHGLIRLRDPDEALAVLGLDDFNPNVALCICCANRGELCPHGQGRTGKCPDYRLDESKPNATEERILAFLGASKPPN